MSQSTIRVIAADNSHEDRQVDDAEIIGELLNGASIRTFMVPDSAIPSNFPEHIETYDLPHVIINGDYFWAKSENAHLGYTVGQQDWSVSSFCYTNICPIFCSHMPAFNVACLMSRFRYKTHCWNLKDNYSLIWDSEKDRSAEGIRKAIERCSKFKIAMLDSEGVWNIHPVDLPMYYPGTGSFELKTVMGEYPVIFRYPSETKKLFDEHQEFFARKPLSNVSLRAETQPFYTFYCLNSDGTYYNFYDIPRNTKQKYKRLKVFVDAVVEKE